MDIREGSSTEYLVTAKSGRCVAAFEDEQKARNFINERSSRVPLNLFKREIATAQVLAA